MLARRDGVQSRSDRPAHAIHDMAARTGGNRMGHEDFLAAFHIALCHGPRFVALDDLILDLAQTDVVPPCLAGDNAPTAEQAGDVHRGVQARLQTDLHLRPVFRAFHRFTGRRVVATNIEHCATPSTGHVLRLDPGAEFVFRVLFHRDLEIDPVLGRLVS